MQISKEIALKLAQTYDEIEVAENLRDHIVDCLKNRADPDIRDDFGKKQGGLQLGVPSGKSSHRLFDVPWEICQPIINAHIHEKKTLIELLNVEAQIHEKKTLIELLNVEAQKELNAPPPQNNENSQAIPAGVYVKQNSDELDEPDSGDPRDAH